MAHKSLKKLMCKRFDNQCRSFNQHNLNKRVCFIGILNSFHLRQDNNQFNSRTEDMMKKSCNFCIQSLSVNIFSNQERISNIQGYRKDNMLRNYIQCTAKGKRYTELQTSNIRLSNCYSCYSLCTLSIRQYIEHMMNHSNNIPKYNLGNLQSLNRRDIY